MLHTETVERTTLQLLKDLQAESLLEQFRLAGGTALALYLGHRKSVDLDLFTPTPFDSARLRTFLEEKYGFRTDFILKGTLMGTINGVKIDCIAYPYEDLEAPHIENGIRLYSPKDIAAMKLAAISDNGSRLKDFIDVAFLSAKLSFSDMLQCYGEKYPESNPIIPYKAVTYFEDIDFSQSVVMLSGAYEWEKIQKRLWEMSREQHKVFGSFPLKKITKPVRKTDKAEPVQAPKRRR